MQLKANLTKRDYSKFQRHAMFRVRKVWVMFIPFGLLFVWIAFPKDYAARGIPFAVALVIALLMAIAVTAVIFPLSLALTAILPNRPGTVLGEHTFTLTESEFQEINTAGSASSKLDSLRRYETTEHIFLHTPTRVGYILPMRDLQANPDFLRVLRERTKHA